MLDGLFRGTQARARGLLTASQLYGPRYRRIYPDVFAPAGLAPDLALRSRAAYLLARDHGGVLAGYSAALLLGADCAPLHAPAEVLVPGYMRAHTGLLVRFGTPTGCDVVEADGCRVTAPLRTAWDLARRLPLIEAVVAVDALAHGRAFAPADLLARCAAQRGARGCRSVAAVVAWADPRAESPMESRLRVRLVRGGLPKPAVQYEVRDEYGFVLARVDLAYPESKLAIEYDGALHFNRHRTELDRQRDAILASHGWETVRLGRDDVDPWMPETARRMWDVLTFRAPASLARGHRPRAGFIRVQVTRMIKNEPRCVDHEKRGGRWLPELASTGRTRHRGDGRARTAGASGWVDQCAGWPRGWSRFPLPLIC